MMSVITRTDVTAVKLYENAILTGIGSWIHIFDRNSSHLQQKLHALYGQKIYGFVPSKKNEILVFGGKQFTIVKRDSDFNFVKFFESIVCNDWLHSGAWAADGKLALLTAHNVVQLWNILEQSLVSEYVSKENSILYSGFLLPIQDNILVFSGTVFSQVLIHCCGSDRVLHSLKGHKGVIFSVSCDLKKGVIVTTSDDRSVRIWQLHNSSLPPDSIGYWEHVNITCIHELYGHLARVMRHCIRDDFVISIGEDSTICFWSFNGTLLRKIIAHQNSCIWSLDADDKCLVTGGGDSGIILHPISLVTEYGQSSLVDVEIANAKKVVFTAKRNIVIMTDRDDLVYYDCELGTKIIFKLNHESTYKLLSISSCKQLVAVVDMFGKLDVFVESCKGPARIQKIQDTNLQIGKIFFMQWAGNRHLVLSSESGAITVLASRDNKTEIFANFVLPPCKERWLTAAAIDLLNNMLLVGDRCGTLHVYVIGQRNPLKSFKKVHGRYGPTSINVRQNKIITSGRDGTIKYFRLDNGEVKSMYSQNVDFQWVEKFVDTEDKYICGFQERVFVVYDVRSNSKLFEVCCGGGHRSWDVTRYIHKVNDTYEECIKYVYVKNSNINIETFELSKVVSRNIISGTHSKEINCLKSFVSDSSTFFISGGEDTTLRISSLNCDHEFRDVVIFKQLSNIRTLKLCPVEDDKVLAISAGGRAQICVKLINFGKDNSKINLEIEEICDHLIKGTDKERRGTQTWRNCTVDFDPETRIMDLDVYKADETNFLVIAGCSDAYVRVFQLKYGGKSTVFKPLQELTHHKTCVLQTHVFKLKTKLFLITCTTRGVATIWEITNENDFENVCFNPIVSLTIHQSGINSLDCKVISYTKVLIGTGGDDNTINLKLVEINDVLETSVVYHWSSDKLHCSQVTGVLFIDDLIVTTSIDQRVTLLRWGIEEGITCDFVLQVFSNVADIQGLDVLKHDHISITVCVFGKGIEVISIPRPSPA